MSADLCTAYRQAGAYAVKTCITNFRGYSSALDCNGHQLHDLIPPLTAYMPLQARELLLLSLTTHSATGATTPNSVQM